MHNKPHIHHLFVNYLRHKELDDLYISVFLKYLADSLIAVFIPIFFLINGFGIKDIAIFALIHYSFLMLLMTPFNQFGAKIGVKKTMALGIILFIVTYLLINSIKIGVPYFIPAIFSGVASASYWGAYHMEFTKSATRNKEGSNSSIINIIAIIAAVLGPFVGSYLIELTSFTFVFVLAIIILIFSIIPLFLTPDFKIKREKKIKIKKVLKSDSFATSVAYMVQGATFGVAAYLWPAFIYLALNNLLSLGKIFSLTSLIMVFFILIIGKSVDKNNKKSFKLGILVHAPVWVIRIFVFSPIGFFLVNFFDGITRSTISISLDKVLYHRARRKKNLITYFTFREWSLGIGRIIIFSIVLLVNDLKIIFIICGFSSLLYLFLAKKMNGLKNIKSKEKINL